MARTESRMLPLGTAAPRFTLPDAVSGRPVALEALRGEQATLVMFICNHCPYVLHILDALLAVTREYAGCGVGFAAISSNDVRRYPQDAPEAMRRLALERGFGFPYLYDESQAVARAYQAACTPDFYLFDAALELVYRGRFDDATPGNGRPVTGADLRAALDAVLAGRPPSAQQQPSLGCNIKWREP